MVKIYLKRLKVPVVLKIKSLSSFIAVLLHNLAKYLVFQSQFLDLINFPLDISDLTLLLFSLLVLLITSLSFSLEANTMDGLIVFHIKISGTTILLNF